MESERGYLIRYGVMGYVGRFRAQRDSDLILERGQAVVIQTDRGTELGEVLLPLPAASTDGGSESEQPGSDETTAGRRDGHPRSALRVLRSASPDDLVTARQCEGLRGERYALCSEILCEDDWPIELIDIEPLLDPTTTVLHYLGPDDLDLSLLRARFRSRCSFDVLLEPLGASAIAGESEPVRSVAGGGCGSCGTPNGCGSCSASPLSSESSASPAEAATSGACTSNAHSACSSCGVAKWRLAGQH
jgi:hypothetical protein